MFDFGCLRRRAAVVGLACVVSFAATPASAQVASALLREGDVMGAFGTITSINNPAVNHAGGYSVQFNTSDSRSHTWGNATGGPGAFIVSEDTYGDYTQTSFESFHGFSDAGESCYSPLANQISTGFTSLDGVWVNTTPILVERDPVPTLPGQFSVFNSRPGITADGKPHWVGGISTVQGGSTQNRVLFFGAGATPRLRSGDIIGGVSLAVTGGGIDFDYRFSKFGTHYIIEALVASGSTANDSVIVIDGAAVFAGGGIVRESSPVPASIGGLPGEAWQFFDFMGIAESGKYFLTGDTNAAVAVDEFVLANEQIVMREGQVVTTPAGSFTISGAIEGGYMNEMGDWAVTWDVNDAAAVNREALFVNGTLVLLEGDLVDLDGDGTVEPNSRLADFTGISSLVVGPRDAQGFVTLYFTADIDTLGTPTATDDTEGFFRLRVPVVPNQAPDARCRNVTVTAGSSCDANASVDDGSLDPDGDPITLTQDPPGPYPLGSTAVTLTVQDDRGGSDTCNATVTVVAAPLVLSVASAALSWAPAVCDVGYDVVRGDLGTLRSSGGNFAVATVECLANDHPTTSLAHATTPASGAGFWYAARRVGSGGPGTYDSDGTAQVGSRDAGIAASGPAACP